MKVRAEVYHSEIPLIDTGWRCHICYTVARVVVPDWRAVVCVEHAKELDSGKKYWDLKKEYEKNTSK